MARIKHSFSVLGLSRFGMKMATSLSEAGASVIAIDKNPALVHKISESVTQAIEADLMDWDVLERLGVFQTDIVIIGLRRSFEVATLLTYKLKNEKHIQKIIVQVDTEEKSEAIKLIGADITVFPEKDIAEHLFRQLITPNLVDHMSLSGDVSFVEVNIPEEFIGQSLISLDFRSKYELNVVGVKTVDNTGKEQVCIPPSPNMLFKEKDRIMLLGMTDKVDHFVEKISN